LTSLTCFRIRSTIEGDTQSTFDNVVNLDGYSVSTFGPSSTNGFEAKLFVVDESPHTVPWAAFLQSGFKGVSVGSSVSPSALLLVRPNPVGRSTKVQPMFAFSFGNVGRFLLKNNAYERGYGLRVALNLIYPKQATDGTRVRAVETKRHGSNVLRTTTQASSLSDFEAFNVNYLRDIVGKATGLPADTTTWGPRISGGDSISLNREVTFSDLGKLCIKLEKVHKKTDYQGKFYWIDYIQPVVDPAQIARLEEVVLGKLKSEELDNLDLAPPEILDWTRVSHFVFPFDRTSRLGSSPVRHPDLRLIDYLSGLKRPIRSRQISGATAEDAASTRLTNLTLPSLRSNRIVAIDSSGTTSYQWSVWKCLVGEIELNGDTFVLDEGDFFRVQDDYVEELNRFINKLPAATIAFPNSTPTKHEGIYNSEFAETSAEYFLLDKRLVSIRSKTTPIEICDILTKNRELIHVKRHLGSSDLSHLFSQGMVSAELIQSSPEFRKVVSKKIKSYEKGRTGFDCFGGPSIAASDFQIVYAIIERWQGKTCAEAMPFFSKVNLREVAGNLASRGFRVALNQIQA